MLRRYAGDAGPSWRKSWGWSAFDAERAERRQVRVVLFLAVCFDLGALAVLLVTR